MNPVMQRFVQARERLVESATPGLRAAHDLARITDEAVSALAETAFASVTGRWALIAAGGYGAARLLPFSDIDLLLLLERHGRALHDALKQFLYPLWDAGLEIGYAIRTPQQHIRSCRTDIQVLTASISGRPVVGDRALAHETLATCLADARRRRASVLRALDARERCGSPFDLWPDLKHGAGGQRDLDEIRWRRTLLAQPLPDLAAEQDVLLAAAWTVHTISGRRACAATPEHARTLDGRIHTAMGRIAATLAVDRGEMPADYVSGPRWSRDRFLDLCDAGTQAFAHVSAAALHGLLDAISPGLSRLMVLRRPALDHRYTVGAHCVLAALRVSEIYARDEVARATVAPSALPTVIAAALAHDAGKLVPGPEHPARSETSATATALALALSERAAHDAGWLAANHLMLTTTAERADIDDEDVLLACAARIPRADLLGQLYLLTAADASSVRETAWDDWHAALVRTLTLRLAACLGHHAPLRDAVAQAQRVRAQASSLLSQEPAAIVALSRLPLRSLFERTPHEAADDARAVARVANATGPDSFESVISPGRLSATWSVRIATRSETRLLEHACACCTLLGLDILDARLNSGVESPSLLTMVVRSASGSPVTHDTWARLDRMLGRALQGELDVEARLSAAFGDRTYDGATLDWDTSEPVATALRVKAPDKPGLLHAIARAVTAAGLVIVSARAVTRNGLALDTLRVLDRTGQPPRTPGELGHLAMRIRGSLAPRA